MKTQQFHFKRLALVIAATLGGWQFAQAATPLALTQKPLYKGVDLAPNLLVTLDDSGSMTWGYVPDGLCSTYNQRRARAASFNPIAYNPALSYDPPLNSDGSAMSTSFTAAYINGLKQSGTVVNLSTGYMLNWGFNPTDTSLGSVNAGSLCGGSGAGSSTFSALAPNPVDTAAGLTAAKANIGVPAYYYVLNNNAGCVAGTATESCYTYVQVSATSGPGGTDERQNFANWYSFYRTRNLLVASASTRAFATLKPVVRVAWQSINSCNTWSNSSSCTGLSSAHVNNLIAPFADQHKTDFYTWVRALPASGGTPLRSALARSGEYIKNPPSSTNNPNVEFPQNSTPGNEYGCRASYAMLLTDGFWNGDTDSNYGDEDNVSTVLPDTASYSSSQHPYSSSASHTLADIAFKYWSTDLRPVTNNLPKYLSPLYPSTSWDSGAYWDPRNDPATWQHLVTFTVGLGLSKSLSDLGLTWGGNTYAGSYSSLVSGTTAWPTTSGGTDQWHVADLWHAALNSRGQFFSVENPQALVDAFNAVLNRVQVGLGGGSGLGSSASSFATSSAIYQATYNGTGWTGDLIKKSLTTGSTLWSAAAGLATPNANTRVVITSTGSAGIPFRWASLTPSEQGALWSSAAGETTSTGQARVNWLRGDASNEGASGLKFRARTTTKLGDIVDSAPVYVGDPSAGISDASYASFRFANCPVTNDACTGTRTPMVYVGANDGMLHGFRDSDGVELLAYVPSAVFANLKDLTSAGYEHKFYVDGSPIATDALVGGNWKTLLVGGLGAGGRGVYALDVTDPTSFTEANASHIVQWEFGSAADADIGNIYAKPVIAKMQNGKWAAIFGNGYNATGTGKSTLFIVFLDNAATSITGSFVKLSVGSGTPSAPGGLSRPLALDTDLDGQIDTIYAGDIDGKMWKFDVSNANQGSWAVANSGSPLFTATDPGGTVQPITTAPSAMVHPRGGMFLVFGTGMSLQPSDASSVQVQTLYGVWDTPDYATRPVPKSMLVPRTFTNSTSKTNYRTIAGSTISWYSTATPTGTSLGWYANLIDSGERIVNNPATENGKVVFSSTEPNNDLCTGGASSWLIVLDAITGLASTTTVFDVNGDGKYANATDSVDSKVAAGTKTNAGGDIKISTNSDGSSTVKSNCIDGSLCSTNANLGTSSGRLNWRDIAN